MVLANGLFPAFHFLTLLLCLRSYWFLYINFKQSICKILYHLNSFAADSVSKYAIMSCAHNIFMYFNIWYIKFSSYHIDPYYPNYLGKNIDLFLILMLMLIFYKLIIFIFDSSICSTLNIFQVTEYLIFLLLCLVDEI